MARPIELSLVEGKKHYTKQEIKDRKDREIAPLIPKIEELTPPSFLNAKQKKEFLKIAEQLIDLKIFSITDVDVLARYVSSQSLYEKITKELNKVDITDVKTLDSLTRAQQRLFNQAHACASSLCLTINSRCKLIIPEAKVKVRKENKFSRFERSSGDG